MDNIIFRSTDNPFESKDAPSVTVHIRIQQRNGRKCITTIQGLPEEADLKKLTKHAKRTFSCNGAVVIDEEEGKIIQLQGDQRENIKKFLIKENLVEETDIKIHGF
tara:strand:+ start:79 stop:396 length:318 start_codon:yes stop_codon:yes gene_type:complete